MSVPPDLELLRKLYYNPETGLIRADAFNARLRALGHNYKTSDIQQFINSQEISQRFKVTQPESYPVYSGMGGSWCCDLFFMDKYAGSNDKYAVFLTCINVNTRFADIEPVRNKRAETVRDAMLRIMARNPGQLFIDLSTDQGTEFVLFKSIPGIAHSTVAPRYHRGLLVESFHRGLRLRLNKLIRHKGARFIDDLPALMRNYNSAVHSSTGYAPVAMDTAAELAWIREKRDQTRELVARYQAQFPVGAEVRLRKFKGDFTKDSTRWTKKTDTVTGYDKLRMILRDHEPELPQNLLLVTRTEEPAPAPAPAPAPVATASESRGQHRLARAVAEIARELQTNQTDRVVVPETTRSTRAQAKKKALPADFVAA